MNLEKIITITGIRLSRNFPLHTPRLKLTINETPDYLIAHSRHSSTFSFYVLSNSTLWPLTLSNRSDWPHEDSVSKLELSIAAAKAASTWASQFSKCLLPGGFMKNFNIYFLQFSVIFAILSLTPYWRGCRPWNSLILDIAFACCISCQFGIGK